MTTAPKQVIQVACGVLVDAAGDVLLAQRPEGKIAAGWWEFPGGKIEPGESALTALTRELREELDIVISAAVPLIRFRHVYSNRIVVLDTWRVHAYQGVPRACEGQQLQWQPVSQFDRLHPLLPTVTPIERALRAPAHYVFTPVAMNAEAIRAGFDRLPRGSWLRLRLPELDDSGYEALARSLIDRACDADIGVILDRDPRQVAELGAAGWHASSATLHRLQTRPAVPLAVASVHRHGELAKAVELGFDAAVLGPVAPTASHPDAMTLGWSRFEDLRGDAAIPVFAIGGVVTADLDRARAANAQGIAGISAYWR